MSRLFQVEPGRRREFELVESKPTTRAVVIARHRAFL
jgi:hypothetical protein